MVKKSQVEKFNAKYGKDRMFEEMEAHKREMRRKNEKSFSEQVDDFIDRTGAKGLFDGKEAAALITYEALLDIFAPKESDAVKALNNKVDELMLIIKSQQEQINTLVSTVSNIENSNMNVLLGVAAGVRRFASERNTPSEVIDIKEEKAKRKYNRKNNNTALAEVATDTNSIAENEIATAQAESTFLNGVPRAKNGNIDWKIVDPISVFKFHIESAKASGWDGKNVAAFQKLGSDYNACIQKAARMKLKFADVIKSME